MVAKRSTAAASLVLLHGKKCAHEKNHEYNTCGDRKYFTEAYYAKSQLGRMICCECEEEFGSSIKINDKAPAYCCVNRFDKNNPCNHAYCHDCWMTNRQRKRRKLIYNIIRMNIDNIVLSFLMVAVHI